MTISDPLRAFAETLPSGWQLLPFGAMLSAPLRNGIYKPTEFHGRGVRVVNMGELFGFDFISGQEMKRVELTADEEQKSGLNDGDLLFARRSLVLEGAGKCSLVVRPVEALTFESSIIRARPDRRIAEPRFLFYLFLSPLGRSIVGSIATRTAVSGIRGSDLAQLGLPLPPLRVQRQIACILSAYDEMIENIQRRIRTLEAIARAVYRDWFIRLRFPGHEEFPRVSSSVGDIPKGWQVMQLGEIAENVRRSVPKGALKAPQPYVGLEHIPRRSLALDAWETTTDLGSNKLQFKTGEVLFGKIRPYFHKVSVAPFDGLCSADTIVVRARRPEHYAFVVACLSSDEFVAHASATSNGSKMPRANWDVLEKYRVLIPNGKVADQFSAMVADIIAQQQTLIFQIHNLRQTRDLLLPRLLSGRLQVRPH